jgi:hypothetical protein
VAPIGFIFQPASGSVSSRKLKIVRLSVEFCSFAKVISENPGWSTATAKAKAIVGLGFGLRFLHGFRFLHGRLNSNTIHFDESHHIQSANFHLINEEIGESEMGGFSCAELDTKDGYSWGLR